MQQYQRGNWKKRLKNEFSHTMIFIILTDRSLLYNNMLEQSTVFTKTLPSVHDINDMYINQQIHPECCACAYAMWRVCVCVLRPFCCCFLPGFQVQVTVTMFEVTQLRFLGFGGGTT